MSGRAKLVGNIGDEVAAGGLGALDLRNIGEHADCTAAGHSCGMHLENTPRRDRGGSSTGDGAFAQCSGHADQHVRIADGLDQSTAFADRLLGESRNRGVRPTDEAGRSNSDDALLHAVEQRSQLATAALQRVEGRFQTAGGHVEGAGDGREFVEVALLDAGREIARGDALRKGDDARHTLGHTVGHDCCQQRGEEE